ncbi:MAG: 2TM domain-containing protein [Burkholderiaceae bacterium]
MSTPLSAEDIERLARRRAGAKLGWYIHAAVYVIVNSALFAVSAMDPGRRHWSVAPALGWGLGLLIHGIVVFVLGTGSSLRENMVRKERERLERQQRGL